MSAWKQRAVEGMKEVFSKGAARLRGSKRLRLVFPVFRPNDFSVPLRWFSTLRISPTTSQRAD